MNNWTMVSSILWYRPCAAPSGDRRHLTNSFTTRLCRMSILKYASLPFGLECLGRVKLAKHDL